MSETSEFELPSDPKEIEWLKDRLTEISAQEQMIKDRRANINEIKADIKERLKMAAKFAKKLASAMDDETYVEMTAENSMFELVRETIFGDAGLPDDNDVE
jgi:predicted nuclease with TOPRIM domain